MLPHSRGLRIFAPVLQKVMMHKTLLGIAMVAVLATACGDKETVFDNGDKLIIRVDEAGENIEVGDLVTFHVGVYNKDSLINDSRQIDPEGQKSVVPEDDPTTEEDNIFLKVLQSLSQGDSATLFQKFDSTQRAQLPPGIDFDSGLRIEIKILAVGDSTAATAFRENVEREQAMAMAAQQAYGQRGEAVQDSVSTLLSEYEAQGASKAGYSTTASGLKYKILQPGSGPQATAGQVVSVTYYGVLTKDGEMFDNSFRSGRPITFPLGQGQVIPGWDEGIALLNEGARAILILPAEIAYGERESGPIPANSELAFYVQLDDVQ